MVTKQFLGGMIFDAEEEALEDEVVKPCSGDCEQCESLAECRIEQSKDGTDLD